MSKEKEAVNYAFELGVKMIRRLCTITTVVFFTSIGVVLIVGLFIGAI